jgi:phospholipid/cholesterol/gamma-HCH transport system substrate-binding protein
MNEREQRVRLGLFVFAALLAVGTLVVLFGKQPNLWNSRNRFVAQFSNAPNIQPGTSVRRSGIRIGDVDRVELQSSGQVKIEMLIDTRYPPRHNETIAITQSLLSGDVALDLVTDSRPNRSVDPYTPEETAQDPIPGQGPLDTRRTAEDVKILGNTAKDTLDEIRNTLNRVAPEAQRTLQEYSRLSEIIRQAIPEIQQTNDSVRRLADTTRGNIPNLSDTNDKAKVAIENWTRVGERLNGILQTNDKQFNEAVANLNAALQQATKMLSDENQRNVSSIIKNTSQLLSDQNVRDVTETIKNVRTFSENLDPQAIKDLNKSMKQISESVAKADAAIENIRKATQPFADSSSDLSHNLTYSSAQIGLLAKDMRDLIKGYAGSDGSVQRLLTDPTLYNRTADAVYGMEKLMGKLDLILEDLKDFSDQIARHPNRLIFDRGAGLKGSPFAPVGAGTSPRPTPFTGSSVTTPPITVGPR